MRPTCLRRLSLVTLVWFGLVSGSAPLSAELITINFDTDPQGVPIPGGRPITNQYQSLGVVFSAVRFTTIVGQEAISLPNSVFFNDPANPTRPASVFVAFFDPASGLPGVTDYVEFTPTDASQNNTQFLMIAYGLDGTVLAQAQTNVESSGRYNPIEDPPVSLSIPGISRVELTGFLTSPGNFGIEGDAFRFNAPTAVPEPTSLSLALLGLLGISGALRGRLRPRAGIDDGREPRADSTGR